MNIHQDRVAVRLTARDRERLDALCANEEMTASALVRLLLRRRAAELGLECSVPQSRA